MYIMYPGSHGEVTMTLIHVYYYTGSQWQGNHDIDYMYIIIQAVNGDGNHDIDYMYIVIQAVNGDGNHDIDYMYIIIQAVNGDGNHDIDTCILLYRQYGEVTMTLIHVYYYTGSHGEVTMTLIHVYCYTGSQWWW